MNDESTQHEEPVVVAAYGDRGEAEVSLAHLASHGIDGRIVDQIAGGTVPIDGEPGVAVAVRAVDAARAREVLDTTAPT